MKTAKYLIMCFFMPLICMAYYYYCSYYMFTHIFIHNRDLNASEWMDFLFYNDDGFQMIVPAIQIILVIFLNHLRIKGEIVKRLIVYVSVLLMSFFPLICYWIMVLSGSPFDDTMPVYIRSLVTFSTVETSLIWVPLYLYKVMVVVKEIRGK